MNQQDVKHFSGKTVVPVDLFQAGLRSVCGLFDVDPACPEGSVNGHVNLRRRGRLDVAEVILDAHRVNRSFKHIRQDDGQNYFAIFQLQGRCLIRQAGRASMLSSGGFCVVDSAYPSEFVYNGSQSRQISFHLPRPEMEGRFGRTMKAHGQLVEAKHWFPAIRSVVTRFLDVDEPTACRHLEESLLSLIGAALVELSGIEKSRDHRMTNVLDNALRLIEAHSDDAEFSPNVLAQRMGVSARTLQRHFKLLGETAGRHLLEARLKAAYRRIVAGGRDQSVTDIAFAAGFSDLSHFHRAFRAKYGVTPGDLKARI
jgi:AraC family transcriptional activator of tynA and feaB